ncbi:MAG TPA: ABC transporter ATP-binding protein [Firmicutes bacterium]|jgi:ABC-2 type transport system ATP-binding protein|nr:ABC transporter ATP-binding protein [Bacillota bacterium]HHT42298.1 ABC transporter ATP-binding protein [Bacillota bacterium]
MGPVLELKNVTKRFAGFTLDRVSFSLEPGYIMGFIGANGAGKTTTIKLIMNLLRLDEGEIRVLGLDSRRQEQEIKQRIGFVYDESYFYETLTMAEMTRIIAPFYKNWDGEAYAKYVDLFALPARKKLADFSKGMKMKYALAVALSHKAELLIMDEPTSGLDPLVRSEFLDILRDVIQDERCSVLLSSHITSDLDQIADYVTMINGGRIAFSKSKEELLEEYVLIRGERALLNTAVRDHILGLKESKFGFEGLVTNKAEVERLAQGRAVFERPNLEEIMLHFVKGGVQ